MGTQLTISELISEIKKKELLLPEFQRGYKWNRDQVKSYLDSLYKGYPTGAFLLWKTPRPGVVRGQGGITDDASFQLILDGQQRLTSIYALMEGGPPPFYEGEKLFFDLHFNVKSEEFKYYTKQEMSGKWEWVPVTAFFQQGLGQYLGNSPELLQPGEFFQVAIDRLTRLDKVKSYPYYLDILGEREMEEALRIFNLVNSQGTRLTKSDLALSHLCALIPGMRNTLRAAQKRYADEGFNFDLSFFTRCVACVATGSGMYEPLYLLPKEPVSPADQLKDAWLRTERALDYLLNVLKFDALVDSDGMLPSEIPLVTLVVYLAKHGGKFGNERGKNDFLHWFYAAQMWARYSGNTETKLNEDLEALKTAEPTTQLRANLVAERGRIKLEASDLEGRTSQSPVFLMAYVVARAGGAVDWFNGLQLYNKLIGKANGLQYHHIFPSSTLYKSGVYDSGRPGDRTKVNQVANIAFLTQEANLKISNQDPVGYLETVAETYAGALEAQSVPLNRQLWALDAYEEFTAQRRVALAKRINDYMESLLQNNATKPMSITDYIAAGENEGVEFKASLRWDYREQKVNKALEKTIARTLAGFMNAKGGTLLVGVMDDGDVVGLEADFKTLHQHPNPDGWEQSLRSVLGAYISRDIAALVEVSFAEVEGKTIAVVHADAATKPVYLEDGGIASLHVRAGNTTQQLDVKEAQAYITLRFPGLG